MEGTESTTRGRTTARDRNQEADQSVLMYSKPLHRFVQREPRILGIAIVIFGCAEFLMGFYLAIENVMTSYKIFIPYWQGLLFIVCGSLSLYTGLHPSKKMVTVSLAMYIMSILGIVVSVGYRIDNFFYLSYPTLWGHWGDYSDWGFYRMIVIVIFGCAEFLMGFHLASENVITSYKIYTPYWQGFLFIVCGSLSIYTGLHPSKKMVTVSLAMYIMSILGIVVSVGYRIFSFAHLSDLRYRTRWGDYSDWGFYRMEQLLVVEIILFISSLCVSVLLIFLCAVARLALKSTHTQIAIVIFGCAEFLMGFHLASENVMTSYKIYTPYWQGFLFIVCGSLSIYTGLHPSKKMDVQYHPFKRP
ncbi:Membrane-spanning 4-domains subfamily A member 4D [Larimichthys crocea]|uniref:Uncharacterized protein n=1 Tax=Larimichthys crocea TaxID=215358 RepID=A0ACD3RCI9_LARCR|nr:Membrane-spanning 4-domains subfamily A member 4D [Larimichthys crocea]